MTDDSWMERALTLARQARSAGEVPVGALIVRDDELLGQGFNRSIGLHDATAHAEIMALRDAGSQIANYRLPGTTLYVTLEPCPMCVGAMIHARVTRVVFGASDPKTGALGGAFDLQEMATHNHRLEVTAGVREVESRELLQAFFRARR